MRARRAAPAAGAAKPKWRDTLRESKDQFERLAAAARDAVVVIDGDGRIVFWNAQAEQMFGYGSAEAMGKDIHQLVTPPRYCEAFTRGLSHFKETGQGPVLGQILELAALRKDGSEFAIELSVAPVKLHNRWHGIGIARDITERKRAEAAQLESEQRFREMAETISEVFWMSSPDVSQMLYLSPAFERIWGRPRQSVYENPLAWVDAIHPEDRPRVLAALERHGQGEYDVEYRIARPDGAVRWIHDRGFPVRNDAGHVIRMTGIAEDITTRQQAQDGQARLLAILEATPDFVGFATAKDTHILHINPAGRRMCGLGENEDVTKLRIADVHPAWVNQLLQEEALPSAVRDGVWTGECAFRHREGWDIPVLMVLMAHKAPSGEVDVFSTISRDITERKQAEQAIRRAHEGLEASVRERTAELTQANQALRESEHRFRTLLEALPQLVWTCAPDGACDYLSPQWIAYTGIPANDQLGHGWAKQLHPDDWPRVQATWMESAKTGAPYDVEFRIRRHDDVYRWFKARAQPMRNQAGQIVKWLGTNTDIEDQKQAGAELLQSHSLLNAALDSTADGILVIDAHGQATSFNRKFLDLWRIPEALAATRDDRKLLQFVLEQLKDPAGFLAKVDELYRTPEASSWDELEFRDGRVFERYSQPQRLGDTVVGRVWSFRDITEHKRALEDLIRLRGEWEDIFQAISHPTVIIDSHHGLVAANRSVLKATGMTQAELQGLKCYQVFHGADRTAPASGCPMEETLIGRHAATTEMELEALGGTYLVSCTPVLDAAGEVQKVIHIATDITERKRALEEQAALLEIARDIAGMVDLNDILDRMQQRVATLLPCDRIVTYYWHAGRGAYRALAWHGVPPRLELDTIALEFCSGQPVVDRLLSGETVLINDVANQTVLPPEILTHFGLAAVLLVPLAIRGRSMGALTAINAESGRRFDPHQVRLLEGVAHQVGVAIEAAELYRAQEEEAAIAGALARVGQELISSLSSPALLDRLCELTTEVLECDHSRTWLWHEPDEAFVPVAGHGDPPEQWEIIRLAKLGRSALAAPLASMERDGFFNTNMADPPDSEITAWARAYGVTSLLMVPLRRGGELVGFHAAAYCGREEVFGKRHERLACGIGQLAALALENARLFEALERANRLKSDFVATMSHELRTPLNIIMGYNDLLLEGSFGPMTEEQTDALRQMDTSAQGLLELITATLDLSRLESGQAPIDVRRVALPDLVNDMDAEIAGLRKKPNVDFAWDVAPDLPPLHTDPLKLKVVLKNLIGNAMKFTDAGSVTVRLRARDGGVEMSVADTGIGMTSETLSVIFDPFQQGEPAMTRRHGGVGLGLYIVRRLLDMLGGRIDVASAVGRGSTFHVWLPLQVGTPAASAAMTSKTSMSALGTPGHK